MTIITNDAIPAPDARTLFALRSLAVEPSQPLAHLRHSADKQAALLRNMLMIPATEILTHLSDLIPSILIDYVDDMPVPGTAFWGNGHWHIHIRASDPPDVQTFTAVHELKHIIDHPLRRQSNSLSTAAWEALADYFAGQVIAPEPSRVTRAGERRNCP
ncbi:MAG: ImmA/IrrE family metallo-endopeptidase [Acidobacteria bacterium]|nr:ImmA/IrrE family metallo-endopeptidase [Acidobacteriota bacterium]